MPVDQLKLTIYGRVQGVFFRSETQKKAQQLQLRGFVQNQNNGSVIVVAQGERDKLMQLREWCKKGPPSAHVDRIIDEWSTVSKPASSFNIH